MNDTDPGKQASASGHPPAGWIDALHQDRVMGELSLWSAHLGRIADENRRLDALTEAIGVHAKNANVAGALDLIDRLGLASGLVARLHIHGLQAGDLLHV